VAFSVPGILMKGRRMAVLDRLFGGFPESNGWFVPAAGKGGKQDYETVPISKKEQRFSENI